VTCPHCGGKVIVDNGSHPLHADDEDEDDEDEELDAEDDASPATSGIPVPAPVSYPKVGRNDPCPCGSGRKFKKCCLGKETYSPMKGQSPSEKPSFLECTNARWSGRQGRNNE